MKSVASKMTLTALLLGVTVVAAQAGERTWVWPEDRAQPMMLAEDGGYRAEQHYQNRTNAAKKAGGANSSDSMVRMIKEQPTAAGPSENRAADKSEDSRKPAYKSPIQRDRERYGH